MHLKRSPYVRSGSSICYFLSGTGTAISYEITFSVYTGAIAPLVPDISELVAESGTVVSAEVIELEEGTEPLRGDFTIRFRGQETAHLRYDSSAEQVSRTGYPLKGVFL